MTVGEEAEGSPAAEASEADEYVGDSCVDDN